MNEEKRNPAAEDGGGNQGHIEAPFCEELLNCYICGKIYFTRRPIRLRTSHRKRRHVCLECSRALKCSICDSPVTARTSILIENLPDFPGGFLCSACRNRAFFGIETRARGFGERLRSTAASAWSAILQFFRKTTRVQVRPRKKRR